jgi:hypothetical protein
MQEGVPLLPNQRDLMIRKNYVVPKEIRNALSPLGLPTSVEDDSNPQWGLVSDQGGCWWCSKQDQEICFTIKGRTATYYKTSPAPGGFPPVVLGEFKGKGWVKGLQEALAPFLA